MTSISGFVEGISETKLFGWAFAPSVANGGESLWSALLDPYLSEPAFRVNSGIIF